MKSVAQQSASVILAKAFLILIAFLAAGGIAGYAISNLMPPGPSDILKTFGIDASIMAAQAGAFFSFSLGFVVAAIYFAVNMSKRSSSINGVTNSQDT